MQSRNHQKGNHAQIEGDSKGRNDIGRPTGISGYKKNANHLKDAKKIIAAEHHLATTTISRGHKNLNHTYRAEPGNSIALDGGKSPGVRQQASLVHSAKKNVSSF